MKRIKMVTIALLAICLPSLVFPNDHADSQAIDTVVFCCSESMDLEIPWDKELGRVAVVRNMGNVVSVAGLRPDRIEIASIEYAVDQGAKRVIVLGHKGCRIVKSVIDNPTGRGNLPAIFQVISKSVTLAKREVPGNSELLLQRTIENNVRNTMIVLRDNRFVLYDLVQAGKLEITGAIYNPETTEVEPLK